MMKFMQAGKGRVLKIQILTQYTFHISHVWTPLEGPAGGGGRERSPNAFRQVIDFAKDARPLPPAENGLCVKWSEMKERCRRPAGWGWVRGAGPHSKLGILLNQEHPHPLTLSSTLMEH